jgi:hypothetical protein
MGIVLVVALVSSTSNAFQGSQLIQKEYNHEQSRCRFHDDVAIPSDEYVTHQTDIDEYDQHVCDDVCPPKISAAKAMLTEMLGFVFLRYITVREMAHSYCKEIKDIINSLVAKVTG